LRQAGYLTLAGAIDDLGMSGFIENFGVSGGALRSFDSGRTFSAAQVVIREYHRFEEVSDPGDMSIVYAIEGQGGVRGTLVDAFGVYSDPAVCAFLDGVPIRGASQFGGGVTGRSWVFGPPGEIRERRTIREPSLFGSYSYGFQVPVPQDPWQEEGGESGPTGD
jgi:hypothetical protein